MQETVIRQLVNRRGEALVALHGRARVQHLCQTGQNIVQGRGMALYTILLSKSGNSSVCILDRIQTGFRADNSDTLGRPLIWQAWLQAGLSQQQLLQQAWVEVAGAAHCGRAEALHRCRCPSHCPSLIQDCGYYIVLTDQISVTVFCVSVSTQDNPIYH